MGSVGLNSLQAHKICLRLVLIFFVLSFGLDLSRFEEKRIDISSHENYTIPSAFSQLLRYSQNKVLMHTTYYLLALCCE